MGIGSLFSQAAVEHMYLLYAAAIPYIYYTLTRWRTPTGHGLNWTEPVGYKFGRPSMVADGTARFNRIMRDLEWHPDDSMRTTVSSDLTPGEVYHVPLNHRSKGVAGECLH